MTSQNIILLLLAIIFGLSSWFGGPATAPEPPAPADGLPPLLAAVHAVSAPLYDAADGGSIVAMAAQDEPLIVLQADGERWLVRTVRGEEGFVPRSLVRARALPSVEEDFIVMGYYMDDATGSSLASLKDPTHPLTAVAPWSWGVTSSGQLRPVYFREQRLAQVLNAAGSRGLKTYALIHNFNPELGTFDADLTDAILGDPEIRSRTAANVVDAAVRWGLSGIHIDFEGVRPAQRNDLTAFMAELAEQARAAGLDVSIAVPAKTAATDRVAWTTAYDYGALAQHVDFLVIMAYDQHWRGGPVGPVAALPWVRDVVEYALDGAGGAVPPQKVVLGVPVYGYDWPADAAWADAVTFQQAMDTLQRARWSDPTVALRWHAEHGAPYFLYGGRTVWFENEHSAAHKLLLAAEYNLAGVAFWRLGQEDPRVWDLVERLKS